MVTHPDARRKDALEQIARRAVKKYGFLPDFSAGALRELETVQKVDPEAEFPGIDLRHLLWVSIDNDDSLDLEPTDGAGGADRYTGESFGGRHRRGGPRPPRHSRKTLKI
jgi:hypothetical protein